MNLNVVGGLLYLSSTAWKGSFVTYSSCQIAFCKKFFQSLLYITYTSLLFKALEKCPKTKSEEST